MLLTLLRRFGLLAMGLLIGLVTAEGCVRVGSPLPGEDIFYGGPIPTPVGMHVWCKNTAIDPAPGFEGTMRSLGIEVELRFNSLGIRGDEPPPGPKWMAIGDSFTLGTQVNEEETWVARLSERAGVPILNAGVNAYSTVQATRRYAELADVVDVDLVILNFFLGNDLRDNLSAEQVLAQPEQDYSKPPPGMQSSGLRTFLYANSYLLAYAHVARNRYYAGTSGRNDDMRDDISIWSYEGQPRLDTILVKTRTALEELKAETERRGDRLVMALAPPSYAVDSAMLVALLKQYDLPLVGTDNPRTIVARLATELGIPVCDLHPALKESHDKGRRVYLRYDGHWNRTGHRVVADELAACLKRNRLR